MGHELMHVCQIAALANQSVNVIDNPTFRNMMEFHAYSYRSTSIMNSFTQDQIREFSSLYPSYFNSMSSVNIPWTSNTNFKYSVGRSVVGRLFVRRSVFRFVGWEARLCLAFGKRELSF